MPEPPRDVTNEELPDRPDRRDFTGGDPDIRPLLVRRGLLR